MPKGYREENRVLDRFDGKNQTIRAYPLIDNG
jgi:hypothetical protein